MVITIDLEKKYIIIGEDVNLGKFSDFISTIIKEEDIKNWILKRTTVIAKEQPQPISPLGTPITTPLTNPYKTPLTPPFDKPYFTTHNDIHHKVRFSGITVVSHE